MNISIPTENQNPTLATASNKPEWGEVWKITRSLLVVWATAVWVLLILFPGIAQINDMETATLHLPYVLMGLVLVGAVIAAQNLRADRHLLWFLTVLLLLAGWI